MAARTGPKTGSRPIPVREDYLFHMLFFLDLSKLNLFRFRFASKLIVELTESKKNFNLINPQMRRLKFLGKIDMHSEIAENRFYPLGVS